MRQKLLLRFALGRLIRFGGFRLLRPALVGDAADGKITRNFVRTYPALHISLSDTSCCFFSHVF